MRVRIDRVEVGRELKGAVGECELVGRAVGVVQAAYRRTVLRKLAVGNLNTAVVGDRDRSADPVQRIEIGRDVRCGVDDAACGARQNVLRAEIRAVEVEAGDDLAGGNLRDRAGAEGETGRSAALALLDSDFADVGRCLRQVAGDRDAKVPGRRGDRRAAPAQTRLRCPIVRERNGRDGVVPQDRRRRVEPRIQLAARREKLLQSRGDG